MGRPRANYRRLRRRAAAGPPPRRNKLAQPQRHRDTKKAQRSTCLLCAFFVSFVPLWLNRYNGRAEGSAMRRGVIGIGAMLAAGLIALADEPRGSAEARRV